GAGEPIRDPCIPESKVRSRAPTAAPGYLGPGSRACGARPDDSRDESGARAEPARRADDEVQHLGDGAVELDWNLVADLDLRQGFRQAGVLLDRHAMLARHLDDFLADLAAAGGNHARRARLLLVQRDGKRDRFHDARSRKRPAGSGGRGGSPLRTSTSPGSSSACISAWVSRPASLRSRAALAARSAHSVTLARVPLSAI